MELQLGLALPSNNPMKGFDLNGYVVEPNEEVLGSDHPMSHVGSCLSSESIGEYYNSKKRRSFDDAFQQQKTLPLFYFWNSYDQPNEEDDHRELDKNSSTINNMSDGDEEGVVGWPPIRSWRKKFCHQNRSGCAGVDNVYGGGSNNGSGGGGSGSGGSKSTYVKVKMEGMAIARKVDLSRHNSYETLLDTLVGMFGRGQENVKAYKLAYQDREGDWLLAGDLPWSSFIQSVQRLKVLRSID